MKQKLMLKKFNYAFYILIILLFAVASPLYAQQKIFWTDDNESQPAIHCAGTDGISCKDTSAANNTVLLNLDPSDSPRGIAIDEKNQKIVWANDGSLGTIERCNLDGTGREVIVSGTFSPSYLAIDYIGEKIYWSESSGIFSSNLDGSSAGQLNSLSVSSLTGLAIDSTNNLLFWAEQFSSTMIYKTNLTSISQMNIVNLQFSESLYGMTLNPATNSIYWATNASPSASLSYLSSYNMVASASTLLSGLPGANSTNWNGIALDYPESNLYYANSADLKIYKTSITDVNPVATLFLNTSTGVRNIAFSCGRYAADTDSDGAKDCAETCDNDPAKTSAGICGCGVSDADTDKDGTVDCMEVCDNDPLKLTAGVCGCGVSDVDTDKDGVPDCNDACPSDGTKTGAGTCGCGLPDTDSDKDGVFDCNDGCPEDARKTAAGVCGCGLVEDISKDGKNICLKNKQLSPNTKIENPPIVTVAESIVEIILEKFTNPTLTLKKKKGKSKRSINAFDFYIFKSLAKSSKLKVRYDIQLTKTDAAKKNITKLTSKRNVLTLKNLQSGNYNIKYQGVILQQGSPAAKTKFSPTTSFTVQ